MWRYGEYTIEQRDEMQERCAAQERGTTAGLIWCDRYRKDSAGPFALRWQWQGEVRSTPRNDRHADMSLRGMESRSNLSLALSQIASSFTSFTPRNDRHADMSLRDGVPKQSPCYTLAKTGGKGRPNGSPLPSIGGELIATSPASLTVRASFFIIGNTTTQSRPSVPWFPPITLAPQIKAFDAHSYALYGNHRDVASSCWRLRPDPPAVCTGIHGSWPSDDLHQ